MRQSKADKRHTTPYRGGKSLASLRQEDPYLRDLRVWLEGDSPHLSFNLLAPATVSIERCGSPAGPFRAVQTRDAEPGLYKFRDDDSVILVNTRFSYYRVRLTLADEPEDIWYGWDKQWDRYDRRENGAEYGITWRNSGTGTPNAPAVVRELRPRFDAMLTQFAGVKTVLYRPAWDWGACTQCTDPRTGTPKVVQGNFCSGCFGTGFDGGFYSPILTDRIPATAEIRRIMGPIGHLDLHQTARSILGYWPWPEQGDILRDLTGKVWRVSSCYDGDLWGHSVMSLVGLEELPISHPVNSIALPDGFREASAYPRRQSARAMNLKSFYASATDGAMTQSSKQKQQNRPPGYKWGEDWGADPEDGTP